MEAKTLALYLGCECTEAGLSSRGNTLVEVAFDGYETSSVRTPQGSILNIKTENIKPLLRPLSSMTEEESILLQEHLGWIGASKDQVLRTFIDDLPEYFSTIIKASNWLRSKGFDCDNLIKNNEAIDSTKL